MSTESQVFLEVAQMVGCFFTLLFFGASLLYIVLLTIHEDEAGQRPKAIPGDSRRRFLNSEIFEPSQLTAQGRVYRACYIVFALLFLGCTVATLVLNGLAR